MGHSEHKRLPSVGPKTTSKSSAEEAENDPAKLSGGAGDGSSDYFEAMDVESITGGTRSASENRDQGSGSVKKPALAAESAKLPETSEFELPPRTMVPRPSRRRPKKPASKPAKVIKAKATKAVPLAKRLPAKTREPLPQIFAVDEDERFEWRAVFTRQWLRRNWGFFFSFFLHTIVLLTMSLLIVRAGIGDSRINLDVADAAASDEEVLEVELDGLQMDDAEVNFENEALEQVFENELESEDLFDPVDLAEAEQAAMEVLGGPMHRRNGDGKSATFFGTQAIGNKFVFVVDRSTSMEYGAEDAVSEKPFNRYDIALAELLDAINSLKPHQEFLVIMFAHDTRVMFDPKPGITPTLATATRQNKQRFQKWLEGLSMGWGTDPRDGLELAYRLAPDAIFLLSDGAFINEQRDNEPKSRDIVLKNSRVPGAPSINTIALEGEASRGSLKEIASISNGLFRFQTIDGYLKQVLETGESSFQFRAISYLLNEGNLSWEQRSKLVEGQLVRLLSDPSAQTRFVAEQLLHQATWGLFEKQVPSIEAERKQAAAAWRKIAKETRGFEESSQISALDPDLKYRERLWLALAKGDIESALPLLAELDESRLQPRTMVAVMLGIVEFQREEGPTSELLGWLRFLGRQLDGKPGGDREKLGESEWGYAQSRAFVVGVLDRRARRSFKLYAKVADADRAWSIREKLAWRLVNTYPETRESVLAMEFLRKNVDDTPIQEEAVTVEELLGIEAQ